jgi:RNA polymerase sigma factor (TIGR02999 family)
MTDPNDAGPAPGDPEFVDIEQACATLYPELRTIAHARLRRSDRVLALDTTSLVHDAFLRLVAAGRVEVGNRHRFLAYASRVMRSVVVDLIREQAAQRRGGPDLHVTLRTDIAESIHVDATDVIRVHDALTELESVDARLVRIVEMRYFVGLSDAEIAEALAVSERTVRRDWEKARMMLRAAML